MSKYFDSLCDAMDLLAQHPRAVFMGQSVACPGTAMFNTLKNVPMEKRLELPVFEDTQMGMAIGMAMNGELPICIFPRINFMLCAVNQLVNHLDKIPLYSHGGYKPKVIIRTAVATDNPLNPGPQHLGDYTDVFSRLLKNVTVFNLHSYYDSNVPCYQSAMDSKWSSLLVEHTGLYDLA
jgi:pyruvate/2-oxoglutarate/acetoin dehydrogenase E1 component